MTQEPPVPIQPIRRQPNVPAEPRDIPILTLTQPEGSETAGTVNISFALVEQVSEEDEERV